MSFPLFPFFSHTEVRETGWLNSTHESASGLVFHMAFKAQPVKRISFAGSGLLL